MRRRTVRTIDAENFCEFCRQHTKDVVGNRLTKERLDFICHFVFPPSHAELLPVRESKKERNGYEVQLRDAQENRTQMTYERIEETGSPLKRIA